MSVPEPQRADHAHYIGQVSQHLTEHDLGVTLLSATEDGRREARLLVHPDRDAFAEPSPGEALVVWDEENGWWLDARPGPGGSVAGAPVYKGLSVVPDPEDVAAWVVVLLTHPELTPSREGHPLRDSSVDDLSFEEQLARYAGQP